MKLKILLKIVEKVLGMPESGEGHRADMYLPPRLLAMALIFLAGGTACVVAAIITHILWTIAGAVAGLVLGIFALLCWKNQAIHILSPEQFSYTTMFGNTTTYSFSDIQGLRKNRDSMTLLVAGKKIHMESMAIITKPLADRINQALQALR